MVKIVWQFSLKDEQPVPQVRQCLQQLLILVSVAAQKFATMTGDMTAAAAAFQYLLT